MEQKILCKQVNQFDLVDLLEKLGHKPQKINHSDYWFTSPLRAEKNPSFKVNRKLNVWYDHGMGKGGTLIDFGILYFKCSVKDLLQRLNNENLNSLSFHRKDFNEASEKKDIRNSSEKIIIVRSRSRISDLRLRLYLHQRQIPHIIANQFCREVLFELYGKKHLAIGFQNDKGGYELRSEYFKGSNSPKHPTLIREHGAKELAVFEGFFNFLSFQKCQQNTSKHVIKLPKLQPSFLILNSISFFEKSRQQMEAFDSVHLFLDNDLRGRQCTQQGLSWSAKFHDQSKCYGGFKDLNECLMNSFGAKQKQTRSRGIPF